MRRSRKQGVGMPDLQTLSVPELARSWKWPLWLRDSDQEGKEKTLSVGSNLECLLPSQVWGQFEPVLSFQGMQRSMGKWVPDPSFQRPKF